MKVKVENLPEELKTAGAFCLWRYEDKDGRRTKLPYNPKSPDHRAKSTDKTTFASLKATMSALTDKFDGIGVGIFDQISAIDIDHCIKDGKPSEMAADIVDIMHCYTEVSPSGEGLRLLFRSSLKYDKDKYYINNQKRGLEVYVAGVTHKYVTVTGNVINSGAFEDRTRELETVLNKYMAREQKTEYNPQHDSNYGSSLTDAELLEKAINSKNGDKFANLWYGDFTGYPSQSEADQALCNQLAFWTGCDAGQMQDLFLQSGLSRIDGGKYKNREHYIKYLDKTIKKAIENCKDVYNPDEFRRASAADDFKDDAPEAPERALSEKGYTDVPLNDKNVSMGLVVNQGQEKPGLFNADILYNDDSRAVFITKGADDAQAIIDCGYPAVAYTHNANIWQLLEKLELMRELGIETDIILCPGDSKTGRIETGRIQTELQKIGIEATITDIHKNTLVDDLRTAAERPKDKPDNTLYYINSLMSDETKRFKSDRKTGFKILDKKSGGLYAGLYVLAAIPSLGKTTFALQLADQIATDQKGDNGEIIPGSDVLFFSLEQSRLELVSKSLARYTAKDKNGNPNFAHSVTSLQIRKGAKGQQITKAIQKYTEDVKDRVSIIECNLGCNITFIVDYIESYIRRTGKQPVVFIDYLQILKAADDGKRNKSTKEIIDDVMEGLRTLNKKYGLTVIVISAENRENYLSQFDYTALKESGAIEYGADVVWGLQLDCLNNMQDLKPSEIDKKRQRVKDAKAKKPRDIELLCLKNRYGESSYSCFFSYYSANDIFVESIEDFKEEPEEKTLETI